MLNERLVVLILVTWITACSSGRELPEDNWYDVGYSDGIRGHYSRTFSELKKLGQVNQAEYDQGYMEGIKEYCNPNFAYQIGLSGQYYEGACEGTKEAQRFRMEWKRGWSEFN